MTSLNLRSELTTSQNSTLALQQRISVLEAENDRQANSIKTSSEDIIQLQQRLHQATTEKERNNEIAHDKDEEVTRLRTDLQAAQDKLQECEARLIRVKDVSRKGMEGLSRKRNGFNQLKLRFDASQDSLQRTKDELELFKSSSEHHLKIVESHLDENGRYLHKSAETRALVAELQQDRHSGQQVIDIMRDKLQNMGSQLIESKQRVADLELRQLEDAARWTRRSDGLQALENKVQELAEKLVKRETESFDILLESANLSSSRRDAEDK
ncbi:hypothetical protein BDZ89DRAFT_964815 [Hymenopellis radicata]|nr:hypothetical protein BDZ89DRAFT_964815 [Hymenopellis radicata]